MSEAYTETVLDHFRHPRNVGVLKAPDAMGRAENPASGAVLELYLQVAEGRIVRTTFLAQGCTATIAVGSALTEMLTGRSLDEAGAISHTEVEAAVGGLPPTKRYAGFLAQDAIQAAVDAYRERCRGVSSCARQGPRSA